MCDLLIGQILLIMISVIPVPPLSGNAPGMLKKKEREGCVSLISSGGIPLEGAMICSRQEPDGILTTGIIRTYEAWGLLEPWWNHLLGQTPGGHLFQEYEYLRRWWLHLGQSNLLYIVVASRREIPAAIAPMQIQRVRRLGFTFRRLTFIGSNSEVDRPTVLCDASETRAPRLIAEYLLSRRIDWDLLVLPEQCPKSPFFRTILESLTAAGYCPVTSPASQAPRVCISGTWKDYLESRNHGMRKSIRRKINRLKKEGVLRFESNPSRPAVESLKRYLEVEQRSWKVQHGQGAGKSHRHREFYRSLAEEYDSSGRIKFAFLYLDQVPVAAAFGIVYNECFYSLHIAHDEKFAQFSPGFVLTAMELEKFFKERECSVFDFLSGFFSNKGGWATEISSDLILRAPGASIRGRLGHYLWNICRPALRSWFDRTLFRLAVPGLIFPAALRQHTPCLSCSLIADLLRPAFPLPVL